MLLAFILFISGYRFYKVTPAAKGNVVFNVIGCIFYAGKQKILALFKGLILMLRLLKIICVKLIFVHILVVFEYF